MKRIYVQNGIVFFYGNPAGYLGDGKAVIDCMFQKEELVSFVKEQFLVEPVFREGVYDRLSEGGGDAYPYPEDSGHVQLRRIRNTGPKQGNRKNNRRIWRKTDA